MNDNFEQELRWSHTYKLKLKDKEEHLVELYSYTPRCYSLITSTYFGKAFSSSLKSIGGKFNKNLKIDGQNKAGWIFGHKRHEELKNLLKNIKECKIKPQSFEIYEIDEKKRNNKIVNSIKNLMDLVPDNIEEHIVSDNKGIKTIIYFNPDATVETKGNCIYSCKTARKKFEIYQSS